MVELTHGNFITLMESKDRDIRKGAYEAMYGTYEQFQHTYAQTLQGVVKVHNYQAKVRHYNSARHAALAANFIPESVYDSLLESVNKHLPLLHRYLDSVSYTHLDVYKRQSLKRTCCIRKRVQSNSFFFIH